MPPTRFFARLAGVSYLIIFVTAVFANFLVLDGMRQDPMEMVGAKHMLVRFGAVAFLVAAVFDVVVAWALQRLFPDHPLTTPSTWFRILHAGIMGLAVSALVDALQAGHAEEVLYLVHRFDTMWLIGLFFFGIHLIMLSRILRRPVVIAIALAAAGTMYMVDTVAHFVLADYDQYAGIFLTLVAIPSIFGEMALAIWLLVTGGPRGAD